MVDIQSATAEISEEKKRKEKEEEKETTGQKYNGLPCSIGRPYKGRIAAAQDICAHPTDALVLRPNKFIPQTASRSV